MKCWSCCIICPNGINWIGKRSRSLNVLSLMCRPTSASNLFFIVVNRQTCFTRIFQFQPRWIWRWKMIYTSQGSRLKLSPHSRTTARTLHTNFYEDWHWILEKDAKFARCFLNISENGRQTGQQLLGIKKRKLTLEGEDGVILLMCLGIPPVESSGGGSDSPAKPLKPAIGPGKGPLCWGNALLAWPNAIGKDIIVVDPLRSL